MGLYGCVGVEVGVNFAEQFRLNPVILPVCLLCMMMFNPIIKSRLSFHILHDHYGVIVK